MTSLCLQGTSRSCLLDVVEVVGMRDGMRFYVGDIGFDEIGFDGDVVVGMVLGDVRIVA